MNKVFLDSNVCLDLLMIRHPFYDDASRIFSLADKNRFELHASSLTFAHISYHLAKVHGVVKAKDILRKFRFLVSPTLVDVLVVDKALASGFLDFEDAMQSFSSEQANLDVLITRNKQDFKNSNINVMNPQEFLTILKIS